MSIWTISLEHLASIHSWEVEFFDANHITIDDEIVYEWLWSRTPTIEFITEPNLDGELEYRGALIHHIINDLPGCEDKPSVWTDTRKHRTYCEYRDEIVFVETSCDVLAKVCEASHYDTANGIYS